MNLPPLTQCPPAQGSVLLVFLSDAELYSHTEISKWREEIMVNMRKITWKRLKKQNSRIYWYSITSKRLCGDVIIGKELI